MPRGSVWDLVHTNKEKNKLSIKRKMLMAKETAQAMNWLHKMQPAFLHLDLKVKISKLSLFNNKNQTANLLVDENYVVKIADFGNVFIGYQ